jgi:hypothetical protein
MGSLGSVYFVDTTFSTTYNALNSLNLAAIQTSPLG